MPAALLPVLLVTHIALAISLFLPSLLLPFTLRAQRATGASSGRIVRFLIAMQSGGTLVVGVGLVASGAALIAVLGSSLLAKPWLIVALAIYALNLVVAFFIQRPNLRPLLGIRPAAGDMVWATRARRQRYVSYAMAAMIGTIGFLMSTKPVLW